MPNAPNSHLGGRVADCRAFFAALQQEYAQHRSGSLEQLKLGDGKFFCDEIMEVIEDFEGQGRPVVELADDNAPIPKQRHFRVPFERLVNLEALVRK